MPNSRISPSQAPWAESIQPAVSPQAESSHISANTPVKTSHAGATFDSSTTMSDLHMSDLKKLQDPAKFSKARFSFRLYKR